MTYNRSENIKGSNTTAAMPGTEDDDRSAKDDKLKYIEAMTSLFGPQ